MNNLISQMLLALAASLAPIVFNYLNGIAVGFPLSEASILSLLVWVVSLTFAGAKIARVKDGVKKLRKDR